MKKRLLITILACLFVPRAFAYDDVGTVFIEITSIYMPAPFIELPAPPVVDPGPFLGIYFDSQEQRAKDIYEDPNATITTNMDIPFSTRISSYGINARNPYLGSCDYLVSAAQGYPIIEMEGNNDKLCWLGFPELRDPQDIDDGWVITPDNDLVVFPSIQTGVMLDFNFSGTGPNTGEVTVCAQNPQECWLVFRKAADAATTASGCQLEPTNDGIANAILHAAWAALSARELHKTLNQSVEEAISNARIFTDAHEATGGTDCQTAQQGTPTYMDCKNNDAGFAIFRNNPNLGLFPLMERVLIEMQEPGRAIVLVAGACPDYTPPQ